MQRVLDQIPMGDETCVVTAQSHEAMCRLKKLPFHPPVVHFPSYIEMIVMPPFHAVVLCSALIPVMSVIDCIARAVFLSE